MTSTNVEFTAFIKPVIDLIRAAKDEYKHAYFKGLVPYIHDCTEKFYTTNTFLHRDQKMRFSDVYYPLRIIQTGTKESIIPNSEFLENHKFITIIGTAGSGKSMLMKHLFLESVSTLKRIPIFIELRKYNHEVISFNDFIFKSILNTDLEPSKKTLDRALKSGIYIFIFDGLDEITLGKKDHFISQLEDFIDVYRNNNFVISSRPRSGADFLYRFEMYNVAEIQNIEYPQFINKVVLEQERRDNLIRVINDEDNNQYLHYFNNPLLFSMFILTFESHPEIPKKKSSFYRNVFDTLYDKHDGINKNSFTRTRKSKLQKDEFIQLISYFSAYTFLQGQYYFTNEMIYDSFNTIKKHIHEFNFDIEDLISDLDISISILIKDGLEYTFPHRSLQEYFTALFVKDYIPSEDNKSEFINKLLISSKYNSLDRHKNLWNIIYEIDKKTIIKYHLIPTFEKISNIDYSINFEYKYIFEYLDFGFYFTNMNKQEQANSPNLETITNKINKQINKDLTNYNLDILSPQESSISINSEYPADQIRLNTYIPNNQQNNDRDINLNKKQNRRQMKIRHVDSIYWDSIDIRIHELKTNLFLKLNNSFYTDSIQRNIVNNSTSPIPDNQMTSFKELLPKDEDKIIQNTFDTIELYSYFIEIIELIKKEIENMKRELYTNENDFSFIFKKELN